MPTRPPVRSHDTVRAIVLAERPGRRPLRLHSRVPAHRVARVAGG
jgi:hypothetical protein